MSMPKSVTRNNKNGIKFVSSVDKVNYTIKELSRGALRDVKKMLLYKMRKKFGLLPGLKKATGRFKSSYQGWVRPREADLQIGIKTPTEGAWYSVQAELGSHNQPKREIIRSTVMESIADIRIIEGKYLSAIEDENKALGLIDKSESSGKDD